MVNMMKNRSRSAFTIVELIVVIAVVGILAGIILVSYGAWRSTVATSSLKSDLEQVASVIESSRTFDNSYPLSIPASFSPSSGNTITLTIPGTKSFCIDGQTSQSSSIKYYIDDLTQSNGATAGTCTSRTSLPIPGVVTNVVFTADSVSITVNWTLAAPNYANRYLVQCSLDPGFVTGLLEATVMGGTVTTATLTGVTATSAYFCHVRAMNADGQSKWSNTGTGDTQEQGCVDTNQYGTFPDCYDYDSLPIATSIAGYWSTAPTGYLLENGSAVSRTTYADLFAAIGTTYGTGDGSTTFNLPDSRGRTAVNLNSSDAEFNTVGEKYGEKVHTLTTAEMPVHSHNYTYGGGQYAAFPYTGNPNTAYGLAFSVGTSLYGSVGISATGGGVSHNVIQPSIVKLFAIKYRPSTGSDSLLPASTSIDGYWSTAPTGYLLEDGAAVSRTTYADLFAAIGTTYGAGNGSTTFNVPDSRGRTAVNLLSTDAQFATRGLKYGEKNHTLTYAEMPSHSHNFTYNGGQYATLPYTGGPNTAYSLAFSVGSPTYGSIAIAASGSGVAHNVIQPSIVKTAAIKYTPVEGSMIASSTGTSIDGYWSTAPSGYLLEDGLAVSRTTYADLFAAIGTTYGAGNGSTTFNVPDSRGRLGVNLNASDAEFNTIGEKYGAKTHTLTIQQLPSHGHNFSYNGGCCNSYWAYTGSPNLSGSIAFSVGSPTYGAIGISSEGGGQTHNIIQPSIVKMFAIKY